MKNIHGIILAAGKGARMLSKKPKVLQNLAGKSLLEHVLTTADKICTKIHVVHGFGGLMVQKQINRNDINWVEQKQQLGTGDAVAKAIKHIPKNAMVLILYGDVPLINESTLNNLIAKAQLSDFALLCATLKKPDGYGRIVRNKEHIQAIVEHKDATTKELEITEINTGIMALKSDLLKTYISKLSTNNAQGELYLTDIVAMAAADKVKISSVIIADELEASGVNDKVQLSKLERYYQQQQVAKFMRQGLTVSDSQRFDCRGEFNFGKDCEIDINTIITGKVSIGDNVIISSNCYIKDAKIGDNSIILANSIIESASVANDTTIGPFARIRPQTIIGNNAKIGNFVEVKKSTIGDNSKISHLSYVGDAKIGKDVNIGAGVITCNYDGINKNQTIINDGAFIGSNTQLVAPVTIGKNAIIGAGSTITKDAPEEKLSLSRSKQTVIKNWNKSNKN